MVQIIVNGKKHEVQASPDTPLLYVLRNELSLNGPKFGCGLGQCGACMVHIGGKESRSCIIPVSFAVGRPVTTLEGLGAAYHETHTGTHHVEASEPQLHPLQQAFIEEQAVQCGYCINGMIMSAAALLAHSPRPSDPEIRGALAYNLCRCGTHMRILRAIKSAAETMSSEKTS
jgi:nicotinate dehydrogenase subunit A